LDLSQPRSKPTPYSRFICGCIGMLRFSMLLFSTFAWSQTPQPSSSNPAPLPYRFTNFVWWSDSDLRAQLKQRIPGLGDEIAPASGTESTVRNELETLLKEHQIIAQVQSEDPSSSSIGATPDPSAPEPAIVFRIRYPQIVVDKVVVSGNDIGLGPALSESLQSKEGQAYSAEQDSKIRSAAKEQLQADGYLEADVAVTHDAPRRDGDRFLVNLSISITPGRQYHISSLSAGGGPLLPGKDLSPSFSSRPGDLAGHNPFGSAPADLRAYYWRAGYADVEVHVKPELDSKHALVAYRLDVTPGPQYHVQNLTFNDLSGEQESKARTLLGLKAGDVFDQTAINALHRKIATDPLLAGYGFTYSPKKDKAAALVDLSLDFYKQSRNLILTPR
jgi:outer membrane protein assembly factor BamA